MIIDLAKSSNWDGRPSLHPERKGQLSRKPGKQNWVEKTLPSGLPTYINSIATALLRKHPEWGISRVIATAVNMVKKMCATGTAMGGKVKVSTAVKAAACKAVATWTAKKAEASDDTLLELPCDLTDSDRDFLINRYQLELSEDDWREVNNVDAEQYLEVLEMATADEMSLRLPVLELSSMTMPSSGVFRKEILRTGSLNIKGKTVKFTKDLLRRTVENFKKGVLDYVPVNYVADGNAHTDDPRMYAGRIQNLSLSADETRLIADISLTDDAKKIVEHNPQTGVSVSLHPHYMTDNDGYIGPTLLHLAVTPRPRMRRMGAWEAIKAAANDFDNDLVINMSEGDFVPDSNEGLEDDNTVIGQDPPAEENVGEGNVGEEVPNDNNDTDEGGVDMAGQDGNVNLAEQIKAYLLSEEGKGLIEAEVNSRTESLRNENESLRNSVANLSDKNFKSEVSHIMGQFREGGVPDAVVAPAEALMLSFRNDNKETDVIELSDGTGNTENVSRVKALHTLLSNIPAEAKVDLGEERGQGGDNRGVELSQSEQSMVDELYALSQGL